MYMGSLVSSSDINLDVTLRSLLTGRVFLVVFLVYFLFALSNMITEVITSNYIFVIVVHVVIGYLW